MLKCLDKGTDGLHGPEENKPVEGCLLAASSKKDREQLGRDQQMSTGIRDLEHLPYEERLRDPRIFSLEKRKLRRNLISVY